MMVVMMFNDGASDGGGDAGDRVDKHVSFKVK